MSIFTRNSIPRRIRDVRRSINCSRAFISLWRDAVGNDEVLEKYLWTLDVDKWFSSAFGGVRSQVGINHADQVAKQAFAAANYPYAVLLVLDHILMQTLQILNNRGVPFSDVLRARAQGVPFALIREHLDNDIDAGLLRSMMEGFTL